MDWSRTRRERDIDNVAMFSLQVTGCVSRLGLNAPHVNHRGDHPTTQATAVSHQGILYLKVFFKQDTTGRAAQEVVHQTPRLL